MKKEGQIRVDSENLFPIIKKWLYSDKDIFLREIVANGCDAIKKYQSLCTIGEAENDNIVPRIDINGLGMTEEEVEKYITQVAFSGAQEFIEKYSDKTNAETGIIGHFGLGFYSAYMIADTVEIDTLSYQKDASPVHWSSDGTRTYVITDGERTDKGTSVIMHFSEEGMEFCDEFKLRNIIKKYCHFMPYEIYFSCVQSEKSEDDKTEEKPVNITKPLWLKAPKDCTTEEYEDFYREVFPDINLPLFWIHLNVDYPFNLKGILYFPKQTDKLQVMPGEIKLFSNQVYIADNIKEVVPEFLMLLKGVIDCPDLPLNVSRSFLQNDGEVAKISKHITKKVADKLVSVFKNERKEYESYWDDISPFIKFGCIKDDKFYDRMKDIILFKTVNDEFKTFSELPKTEDNKVYYVSDMNAQAQYVKIFNALANCDKEPALLHCTYGADRTGIVSFFLEALLGMSQEDMTRDYLWTQFTPGRNVKIKESEGAEFPQWISKTNGCEGATFADKMENHLISFGIAKSTLEKIRSIFVPGYVAKA